MALDNYNAATSKSAYYPEGENRLARLWAREATLHNWKDIKALDFFEGPGTDPTVLDGYASNKLWLHTSSGVTDQVGTIRAYNLVSGDPTLIANWPEVVDGELFTHTLNTNVKFYDTKSDAVASLPTLSNGQEVEVYTDETEDNARTRYRVESGALVLKLRLQEFATYNTPSDLIASTEASRGVGASWTTKLGAHFYTEADPGASDHHLTTAAGVKLYVSPGMNGYAIEAFGVSPTLSPDTNDQSSALAIVSSALALSTGTLTSSGGYVYTNSTFVIPPFMDFVANNLTISAAGSAGTFTNGVVEKIGATPTAMPDLAANVSVGDTSIEFATAHGLSAGDVFMIYNATDGSFSGFRTSYRDGEFCRVYSVVDATNIVLTRPLWRAHIAAVVDCYRCADFATGRISNLNVIAPGVGSNDSKNAIRVQYGHRVEFENVRAEGSGNASFSIANSYECWGSIVGINDFESGDGTYYGIIIGNSQTINLTGEGRGVRHGWSTGGGDTFSIPCIDVHIKDFIAFNEPGNGALAAANWHGNVFKCSYQDGICYNGGLNITGDDTLISNVTVYGGSDTLLLYGAEIMGMTHKIINFTGYSGKNDTSRGLIDVGGNSTAMTSNTVNGGTIEFRNINVVGPNQTKWLIRLRNRGFTGDDYILIADNIDSRLAASNLASTPIINIATVSGDIPAKLQATNTHVLSGYVTPAISGVSSSLVRESPKSGTVSITPDSAATVVNSAVTHTRKFSKAPSVVVSAHDKTSSGGTDRTSAHPRSVADSGHTLQIHRTDAASNFAGTNAVDVSWQAQIWEW